MQRDVSVPALISLGICDYSTSFLDVLHASPTLVRACIACRVTSQPLDGRCEEGTATNDPGCLRTMRLVSKAAGQVAMKALQHWKLDFRKAFWSKSASQGSHEMDRLVQLLSCCNLKHLYLCFEHDISSVGVAFGESRVPTCMSICRINAPH